MPVTQIISKLKCRDSCCDMIFEHIFKYLVFLLVTVRLQDYLISVLKRKERKILKHLSSKGENGKLATNELGLYIILSPSK